VGETESPKKKESDVLCLKDGWEGKLEVWVERETKTWGGRKNKNPSEDWVADG